MKLLSPAIIVSPPGRESLNHLKTLRETIASTNYIGLYGITLSEGEGVFVKDVDGNTYLDCLSGASVNIIGYKTSTAAYDYYEETTKIQHTCFTYSPNSKAIELAELLLSITPGDNTRRVIFGLSGSDVNDAMIKIIRTKKKDKKIIFFIDSYHGTTGLSQQISQFKNYNNTLYSGTNEFIGINYPKNEIAELDTLIFIKKLFIGGEVGGIIFEPIQGDAGVHILSDSFVQSLYSLTRTYNIIFAVDEVQSGMGRTGKWWAIDHAEVEPDILVVGKSLGGGYAPISAVIAKDNLMSELFPGQHILTLAGHPPSCAASISIINYIQNNALIKNAKNIGNYLYNQLHEQVGKFSFIKRIRGKGLMIGIQFDVYFDKLIVKKVAFRCVEKGVYFGYYGIENDVLRIEPPLIINKENVDFILKTILEVCQEIKNKTMPFRIESKVLKYAIGL